VDVLSGKSPRPDRASSTRRGVRVIIYTRPPYPWMWYPYLVLSVTDSTSPQYVRRDVESIIIDSGVHKVFKEWRLKEYPGGYEAWIHRVAMLYYRVKNYARDVYAVIPDYPSDYPENPIHDNVERTIRNIEYALDNYSNVKWIIPIQGRPNSVQSVVNTINKLRELDLLKSDYVAVAPTCVAKSVDFLRRLAVAARQLLRDKKIHMFGVTMRAWSAIDKYIDSTDTVTINHWCRVLFGKMCTTTHEKVAAWRFFLDKLLEKRYITENVYVKALEIMRLGRGIQAG
jgi:hypothetical protein